MSGIFLNGVKHNAVCLGGVSHVRAYKGAALVWEKAATPPPVAVNLLAQYLTAGSAVFNGVTLTINADGSVLFNGTASAQINAKLSNGVEMVSQRPASWSSGAMADIPLSPITLGADVVSGSMTNAAADSFNLTLRYDAETICLNCKLNDGMPSVAGTPTTAVALCALFIRGGTVLNNLLIRPYVRAV